MTDEFSFYFDYFDNAISDKRIELCGIYFIFSQNTKTR